MIRSYLKNPKLYCIIQKLIFGTTSKIIFLLVIVTIISYTYKSFFIETLGKRNCVMYNKINSILSVKISEYIVLILLILTIKGIVTKAFAETMTLRMTVSYFRNSDQTSFTFRETTVDFVTNVFQLAFQDTTSSPRLGQFETSMTSELRSFKNMLKTHYRILDNRIEIRPPRIIPHAPIIDLNEQKVHYNNYSNFSHLESIFYRVREREWTCVRCAEYRKDGRSILRIVRNRGQREQRRTFSTRQLDCRRLNRGRLECVDPQFGIFEIIM